MLWKSIYMHVLCVSFSFFFFNALRVFLVLMWSVLRTVLGLENFNICHGREKSFIKHQIWLYEPKPFNFLVSAVILFLSSLITGYRQFMLRHLLRINRYNLKFFMSSVNLLIYV